VEIITFKPSVFSRLSTFFWGLVGGVFLAGAIMLVREWGLGGLTINKVSANFNIPIWVGPLVGLLAIVFMTYQAFFAGKVHFEVEGRSFRHFVKGDLKFTADDLSQFVGGYSQRTSNNDVTKQDLELSDLRTGVSQTIDCSALSAAQFDKMWNCLKQHGLQTEAPMLITQPKKGI